MNIYMLVRRRRDRHVLPRFFVTIRVSRRVKLYFSPSGLGLDADSPTSAVF